MRDASDARERAQAPVHGQYLVERGVAWFGVGGVHDVDLRGDQAVFVTGAGALEEVAGRERAADVRGEKGVGERVGYGEGPGFVRDVH